MTFLWIFNMLTSYCGPGSSVGIATELRAGWSRDRIPVGARFSTPVQTGRGAHPASCTVGTESFLVVESGWGVTLTPHPPSSAVGHGRVKLYLYSLYGPYGLYRASVPAQGWPLHFFTFTCYFRWQACVMLTFMKYIRHVYKLHVFIAAIHW